MVFDIFTLIEVIWLILPAYAANGLVPIIRGKHPIDSGRNFMRKPIFGHGKTWEGLFFGIIIAIIISLIQQATFLYLPWELSEISLTIVSMSALLGFLLGLGTMLGDLAGSFIKRRINLPRGRPAPVLDQDDFVVGALFFASIIIAVKVEWWILLLIITPIIHWAASIIGYLLKIKKEPW